MKCLDPGHRYELASLDSHEPAILQFVKRIGERYPGNVGDPKPGTNCQEVYRALHDRARYLNGQFWYIETTLVIALTKLCIWLFEFRAARIKRRRPPGLGRSVAGPQCSKCGHVHVGQSVIVRPAS